MHSCVTRKPPRGVQSTLAAACALTPGDAEGHGGRAGDEAGQREDPSDSRDRAARRLKRSRNATVSTTNRRDGCGPAGKKKAGHERRVVAFATCAADPRAHPREHISGDREREHGRPDVDVERVEPRRRRGHPSKGADPQRVEAEDERRRHRRRPGAFATCHRVGEDGPEAQGQRVGPAARKRDLDGQRRRAEQPRRKPALE